MNRRHILAGLACLPLGGLAGCAVPGRLETPPRVTMVGVRPHEIRLLEQRYLVTLRVQTPNDQVLRIRTLDYEIHLNDQAFGSGVSRETLEVPAYGERELELVVSSTLRQLLDQIRDLALGRELALRYGIKGSLQADGIPGRMPFSHEDELSAPSRRPGAPGSRSGPAIAV